MSVTGTSATQLQQQIGAIETAERESYSLYVRGGAIGAVSFIKVQHARMHADGRWEISGLTAQHALPTIIIDRLVSAECMPIPYQERREDRRTRERRGTDGEGGGLDIPADLTTFLTRAHRERWSIEVSGTDGTGMHFWRAVGPLVGGRVLYWDDGGERIVEYDPARIALARRTDNDLVVMPLPLQQRIAVIAERTGQDLAIWSNRARDGGGVTPTGRLTEVKSDITVIGHRGSAALSGRMEGGGVGLCLMSDLVYLALTERASLPAPAAVVAATRDPERERRRELARDIVSATEGVYGAESREAAVARAEYLWWSQ